MEKLVTKSLTAVRESKFIEFKSEFDPNSNQDWCEIIKDIIAISNSGGGVIVFGLNDIGEPSGSDVSQLLQIDSADIINKIAKYVGIQFSDFEILEKVKNDNTLVLMVIESSPIPLVFKKPGTYSTGSNLQKTAFKEGSVYFRHGAKSSPGNTDDLHRSFSKELERVRKSWLKDIGKIVKSPGDHEIVIVPKSVSGTASGTAAVVRLTTDPKAPIIGSLDFDLTHPNRQKELIIKIKEKLPDNVWFNSYDVTSIWYAHEIGKHPEFYHSPKFGSPQYSDAFVDWIINSYKKTRNFLTKPEINIMKLKTSNLTNTCSRIDASCARVDR